MANSLLNQSFQSGMFGHVGVYCVFSGKQVIHTLSSEEFEHVLEHEVALKGCEGNVHMAYVVANHKQLIQSIVLFILPLQSTGFLQEGWRLPLERLSNTANRGPNLGGGRIRLACHSQCSISWHQDSLWEPRSGHFSLLKKAMADYLSKLDALSENTTVESANEQKENKAADNVGQLMREMRNDSATYRNELQVLQQEVERQRLLNERLVKKANTEPNLSSGISNESKIDLQVLRRQNEMLNMKMRELEISNENLRSQVAGKSSVQDDSNETIEAFIDSMGQHEMMSVVYHHGVGHINLTPEQIVDYLEDPLSYAASHANINKLQYKRWLDHEKSPKCHVCDDEISVVTDPSMFDFEIDVYCIKHKPGSN